MIRESALLVVVVACGGKVEPDGNANSTDSGETSNGSSGSGSPASGNAHADAGMAPSISGAPSPGVGCTGGVSRGGSGSSGAGGCTLSQFGMCSDGNIYQVECSCPDAACACTKNGLVTGRVAYAACPSCGRSVSEAWTQCGWP